MSIKKALAILLVVIVVFLVAMFMLNAFVPTLTWLTQPVVTFITVTAPNWIQTRMLEVIGAIGVIMGIIGGALQKIGTAKKQAQQIQQNATEQVQQSNEAVTSLVADNQNLAKTVQSQTTEISNLKTQVTEMEQNRTEAEQLVPVLEAQNKDLTIQLNTLKEQLRLNQATVLTETQYK